MQSIYLLWTNNCFYLSAAIIHCDVRRKVFYKTLRKERKKQWKIDHPNEDMSMSNNNQESLYDNNDSAV